MLTTRIKVLFDFLWSRRLRLPPRRRPQDRHAQPPAQLRAASARNIGRGRSGPRSHEARSGIRLRLVVGFDLGREVCEDLLAGTSTNNLIDRPLRRSAQREGEIAYLFTGNVREREPYSFERFAALL